MTEKELENQIAAAKLRLKIYYLYRDDFVKEVGERGLQDLVDMDLETIFRNKTLLQKIRNNEGKSKK